MANLDTLAEGLGLNEQQLQTLAANLASLKTAQLLELQEDVARVKSGMIITRQGLNLLAKACAGKELCYSRVAFGDSIKNGNIIEPTDAQIVEYTSLIHERNMQLPIADVRFGGGGTAVVKFQVNNTTLKDGFWAREIGLFAFDPDTHEEILYSYKNNGILSTYIPGGGGAVELNLIVSLVTVVDQATNVTAVIDANLLFVSQAEFIAHINSTRPHPNTPCLAPVVNISNFFWATGTDNHLHPISRDDLSLQILGDNIYELPHMEKRIAQTEINISNLFMQLDADKSLGLDANLLLAEDFIDNSSCDLLKIKVDDSVAGINSICVADVTGILEGHFYTVSDGTKNQTVRVNSIAKNGSLYVVVFSENLRYTFNLPKTYLYRSTGLISGGKLSGAGEMRESVFKFSDVWLGESSSSEKVLTLSTTLANKKNFTLDGDFAFADGFFTLST